MLKDYAENLEKNWWWTSAIKNHIKYGENELTDYRPAVERITAESVQALLKQLVEAGNMFEVVMSPAH